LLLRSPSCDAFTVGRIAQEHKLASFQVAARAPSSVPQLKKRQMLGRLDAETEGLGHRNRFLFVRASKAGCASVSGLIALARVSTLTNVIF
jgi:hypothetical protein